MQKALNIFCLYKINQKTAILAQYGMKVLEMNVLLLSLNPTTAAISKLNAVQQI